MPGVIRQKAAGSTSSSKKLIALSLQNRKHIESAGAAPHGGCERPSGQRSTSTGRSGRRSRPAAIACSIDVKRIAGVRATSSIRSLRSWPGSISHTGIRAGAHSVGMQKGTALNDLVRLAIPVGLKQEQVERDRRPSGAPVRAEGATFRSSSPEGTGGAAPRRCSRPAIAADAVAPSVAAPPSARDAARATRRHGRSGLDGLRAAVAVRTRSAAPSSVRDIADRRHGRRATRRRRTLGELWDNLREGRDCIDDIPQERIAPPCSNAIHAPLPRRIHRRHRPFDSLFFNISPREAEIARSAGAAVSRSRLGGARRRRLLPGDPCGRTTRRARSACSSARCGRCTRWSASRSKLAGNDVNPNSFLWSIANRVSYWMNLTRPEPDGRYRVLVEPHRALSGLRGHPQRRLLQPPSSAASTSTCTSASSTSTRRAARCRADGVCRSFGKGANGYVAGRRRRRALLKPLDQAHRRIGDNIYGVIKSAVVNHGGRTSGYTVPNPKAQSELIAQALAEAPTWTRAASATSKRTAPAPNWATRSRSPA